MFESLFCTQNRPDMLVSFVGGAVCKLQKNGDFLAGEPHCSENYVPDVVRRQCRMDFNQRVDEVREHSLNFFVSVMSLTFDNARRG